MVLHAYPPSSNVFNGMTTDERSCQMDLLGGRNHQWRVRGSNGHDDYYSALVQVEQKIQWQHLYTTEANQLM